MKPTCNKLSEQFVDFIDLTDENLEEISVPELGRIQGAGFSCSCSCSCDFFGVSATSFASSCSCGSCSCGSCGSCSCWSCSCWSCSCGSCEGFFGFGSCGF